MGNGAKSAMIKVYQFYHDKELCGFTIDSNIAKQYAMERPHCKEKIVKMNEKEYKGFNYLYSNYTLFQNVMDDESMVVYPITSYKENDKLDNILNKINYRLEELPKIIADMPIKKKYKKLLLKAISNYNENGRLKIDVIRVYLRYISNY